MISRQFNGEISQQGHETWKLSFMERGDTVQVHGELVLKIGEIIANLIVVFISEFIDICGKFKA